MKILSIGKTIYHEKLDITSIKSSSLYKYHNIELYKYIIINGGDGTIRRVIKQLHDLDHMPIFILNPTGSFNVVAKLHNVPKIETVLDTIANGETPQTKIQNIYKLNNEIFLFSAGNMGDLQHIFLSETLRFGIIKHGIFKYILAVIFLLPVHLVMTPFMLLSKSRFFIFTPLYFIKKFGSFYGEVKNITIDLKNEYNVLELDGDIIIVHDRYLNINQVGTIPIVINNIL
jgi:hypothetical protein